MPRLSKIGAAALAAFGWTSGSAVTATYLVVAGGGGGGGYNNGGGGGAGGLQTGTTSLNPSLSYTITVGAGGIGGSTVTGSGTNGSNSQLGELTASVGGGGAGGYDGGSGGSAGLSGGSGGGGGAGSTSSGGSATSGQGFAGGTGATQSGGGGGGSSAAGSNGSSGTGGNGGNGTSSSITGSSVTYAGGGGGSGNSSGGTGGTGGGGTGSVSSSTRATSGTANLGGGGGGQYAGSSYSGGNGGSGIVIISYAGAQQFSGGVVTSVGGNTIHTFTTSGTLGPITPLSASYLIVAGGGSGGNGNANIRVYGGGGAGGMLTGSVTIDPYSNYLVTIGAGGASQTVANTTGYNGSNSSFSMVSTAAVGGGSSGTFQTGDGGSGGGGGNDGSIYSPGSGTAGQGNNGGTGTSTGGGGGGGAGAVGGNASGGTGGNGGAGSASSISGTSTYYAGGGGGGGASSNGSGGVGGGGSGSTAGTVNTGGGGGGTATNISSGAGGSGIVIISYPGSTQQMAGGTVTITGGNVIHTFTSSGYLTPLKYVGNSLRFRSSASAYLSRTQTAGSQTTWTWSGWVKRGKFTTSQYLMQAGGSSGSGVTMSVISDDFQIEVGNGTTQHYARSTAQYRDPSAWYHIVMVCNTTSATSTLTGTPSDRLQIWVNGVQLSSFSASSIPTQNFAGSINQNTVAANIGRWNGATPNYYFDGYMAEVNFIDGQALTPNSFGTFNSYGVWQPITYGGSYGNNGFYLPFTSNASSYAGYFNTGSQYLETTATQIIPATGDFTIEAMTYMTSFANYPEIAVQGTAGNAGRTQFGINSSGQLFIGAGAGGGAATGITMSLNRWYYVAVTRSGSTFNLYVNGILSGTVTASVTVQNTTFRVGIDWGGDYTNGYISNLRVSNVVRTISPSTAPTSNFNNDASTVFLTLQGSTIVDNSSNAYAITNNGTVTVGQTYPFAYNVFNDKSPQGNNWTPNNISGVPGVTLDYMTDVPTLTSATAANYAVLNPLMLAGTGIDVAQGNLYANRNSSGWARIAGSVGVTSGKWYWEITPNNNTTSQMIGIGLGNTASNYPGYESNTYGFYTSTGQKYNNNTAASYGSYSAGQIVGVALDLDNGKIWFSCNGTWQASGDPAAGTNAAFTSVSGTYFPEYGLNGSSTNGYANFGQRPFSYTPPTGFVALNTYNL